MSFSKNIYLHVIQFNFLCNTTKLRLHFPKEIGHASIRIHPLFMTLRRVLSFSDTTNRIHRLDMPDSQSKHNKTWLGILRKNVAYIITHPCYTPPRHLPSRLGRKGCRHDGLRAVGYHNLQNSPYHRDEFRSFYVKIFIVFCEVYGKTKKVRYEEHRTAKKRMTELPAKRSTFADNTRTAG